MSAIPVSEIAAGSASEVAEAVSRLIRAADAYGVRDPDELVHRAGELSAERGLTPLAAIARVRAELDAWWLEVSAK